MSDVPAKSELVDSAALDALIDYADSTRSQSDSQFLVSVAEYERSDKEFEALVAALHRHAALAEPGLHFSPSAHLLHRGHQNRPEHTFAPGAT